MFSEVMATLRLDFSVGFESFSALVSTGEMFVTALFKSAVLETGVLETGVFETGMFETAVFETTVTKAAVFKSLSEVLSVESVVFENQTVAVAVLSLRVDLLQILLRFSLLQWVFE